MTIVLNFPKSTWGTNAKISPGYFLTGTISGPTLVDDIINVQVIYNVPSTTDRPIILNSSNRLGGSTSWNILLGTQNWQLFFDSPGIAPADDVSVDLSFAAFHHSGVQFDSLDVNGVFRWHSTATLWNLLYRITSSSAGTDKLDQILAAVVRSWPSP